jgi:hypothetical protein
MAPSPAKGQVLLGSKAHVAKMRPLLEGNPPRPALEPSARIEEPVFGPRATSQADARCGNALGVPGIRLYYGAVAREAGIYYSTVSKSIKGER